MTAFRTPETDVVKEVEYRLEKYTFPSFDRGIVERLLERIKEQDVALDAYAHGPPAESQQLRGALDRIKELEAELKSGRSIKPSPAPWEGAP